jgi:hypothetical protein
MKLLQMKPKRDKINCCPNFWFGPPFHDFIMYAWGSQCIFSSMPKKSSFFYVNTKANEHGMRMCKEHNGVKNNNVLWQRWRFHKAWTLTTNIEEECGIWKKSVMQEWEE